MNSMPTVSPISFLYFIPIKIIAGIFSIEIDTLIPKHLKSPRGMLTDIKINSLAPEIITNGIDMGWMYRQWTSL